MNPIALLRTLMHSSARRLTRWAAFTALLGLFIFAASLLYPKPLVVVFSMSAGHVIGALAFGLYLLAVVGDTLGPSQELTEDQDEEASVLPSEQKKRRLLKKNGRNGQSTRGGTKRP